MNNILERRDEDVIKRQRIKKRLDNIINLSASDETARLLDEGVVIDGDGDIRFIIKKGSMEKFMNGENKYLPNIDNDYKGFINLGHQDFYANPLCLIGEWDRNDLTLVDIGEERYGVDVNLHLWDWHPDVQLLHKLPYEVGVSAELLGHVDWESTEELGYVVYDEILIENFAVVGNGANANSNGLMLKGEPMDKEIKKLQESLEKLQAQVEKQAEEVEEDLEVEEEETVEEVEEEVEEQAEEAEEEAEEEPEADALSEVMAKIEELTAKMESLEEENKALKESLSAKEQGIKEFAEKFETLSVKLNPALNPKKEEKLETKSRYGESNDGIGV